METWTQELSADAREQLAAASPMMSQMCSSLNADLFPAMLSRVGNKWTLITIGMLGERPYRFTELATRIPGISRRMLTVTLRALERDGLLRRIVYPEVPPRVVYELTDLGGSLLDVVLGMAHWVQEHQDQIDAHRQRFDRHASTQAPLSQ